MCGSLAVAFAILLACYATTEGYVSEYETEGPFLWPKPQQMTVTQGVIFTLDPSNFTFIWNSECDIITEAQTRYRNLILFHPFATVDTDLTPLTEVHLLITDHDNGTICPGYPKPGDDESYSLNVSSTGIRIEAPQVWGLLRGLETLSQLIYLYPPTRTYRMNMISVEDSPSFSFRALRIDTSTHFISVAIIKKNLEFMARNKLNVLQWKIVGKESWPLSMRQSFQITVKGAYGPNHVYEQHEVLEIIEFARLRGIRVIPEVSLPGEMDALAKSRPDLVFSCGDEEMLKLSRDTHLEHFLRQFLAEMRTLFQDSYFHLGIEPINVSCWNAYLNSIANDKRTLTTAPSHLQASLDEFVALVKEANFTPIVLDQNTDYKQFDLDSIVHLSNNPFSQSEWDTVYQNITGSQFIFSSCWQINSPYERRSWTKYYNCEIPSRDANGSVILGGNLLINGDMMDGTNWLLAQWPAAAVVAEKLWMDPKLLYLGEQIIFKRLHHQRCRMVRQDLDFPISPLLNEGPCEHEYRQLYNNVSLKEWFEEEETTTVVTVTNTEPLTLPTDSQGRTTTPEKGEQLNKATTSSSSRSVVLIIGLLMVIGQSLS